MRPALYSFSALAAVCFVLSGCKKEKEPGKITVFMKDAPASYQQVNVEVTGVQVHVNNGDAWVDLPTNSRVYDLLTLQNGIDTTICNTSTVPSGKITEMRLLLGGNNTVMADSVTYPLSVTGSSTIDVVMPGGIDVPPQTTITVLLDFAANESVVRLGNNDFRLKPVIKAIQ